MQANLQAIGGIIIITGHYGCGKTNIAVNMAVKMAAAGARIDALITGGRESPDY